MPAALILFIALKSFTLFHSASPGDFTCSPSWALADAIARAVRSFDADLILVGLAGSAMISAGLALGLRVASEAFPDRRYNPDGTLMSRKQPDAVLSSPEEVAAQAVSLSKGGIDFGSKRVAVDTLCLHGDNPHAAENARLVSEALFSAGIEVEAMGR